MFACVIVSPNVKGVPAFVNVVLIWNVGLFPLNLITAPEPDESEPPVLIEMFPGSPKKPPPGLVNVIPVIPPLPLILATSPVADEPPFPSALIVSPTEYPEPGVVVTIADTPSATLATETFAFAPAKSVRLIVFSITWSVKDNWKVFVPYVVAVIVLAFALLLSGKTASTVALAVVTNLPAVSFIATVNGFSVITFSIP